MRTRYPYPQHQYPILVSPTGRLHSLAANEIQGSLTPTRLRILRALQQGGRVLFDTDRGRALIYKVQQGLQEIQQMTVRTLSWLIRRGYLVMGMRHGRLVHYDFVRNQGSH